MSGLMSGLVKSSRNGGKLYVLIAVLIVCISVAAGLAFLGDSRTWQEESGAVFGTEYHIKYSAEKSFASLIEAELKRVDETFSIFNPRSLVSRINAGETDSMNSLLREVMVISRVVFDDTGGAFDPTVRPAVEAWGFGKAATPELKPERIDSLRQLIGFQKVDILGNRLRLPRGMTLDFGAIAKGYAVDRVARLLQEHGVEDYMVEIGGEIRLLGCNPDGNPWQVGIVKPPKSGEDRLPELQPELLSMTSGAVATSGNYNNTRTIEGRRFSHTINPLTASPQLSDVLSATVITDECAVADAYATAFMVLGKEKSESILARKDSNSLRAILIAD